MATLSELTELLSQVTGVPEATIFAYGRFAREAGYISQGGRGRGGASMSYSDAANLLIAVCGTSVTREAAASIEWFRPVKGTVSPPDFRHGRAFEKWLRNFDTKGNQDVFPKMETPFGDFLERVLQMAGSGELEQFTRKVPTFTYSYEFITAGNDEARGDLEPWDVLKRGAVSLRAPNEIEIGTDVGLQLSLDRSKGHANFRIDHMWGLDAEFASIRFDDRGSKRSRSRSSSSTGEKFASARDLNVVASVTDSTIFVLGLAVAGKSVPKQLLIEHKAARRLARMIESEGTDKGS